MLYEKKNLYLEGKSKSVFLLDDPDSVIIRFEDKITAFNSLKSEKILNKGKLNKQISVLCFQFLSKKGVLNHFIEDLNDNEILCKKVNIFPIEVVIRNIVAGSLVKRIGLKEKEVLSRPICEYYYKNDTLNDPLLNKDHIDYLKLANKKEVEEMKNIALLVNDLLKEVFLKSNLILVDFKLEFGSKDGKIYLADEISPDTCRIWEKDSEKSLDKDLFRKGEKNILQSYEKILNSIKNIIV